MRVQCWHFVVIGASNSYDNESLPALRNTEIGSIDNVEPDPITLVSQLPNQGAEAILFDQEWHVLHDDCPRKDSSREVSNPPDELVSGIIFTAMPPPKTGKSLARHASCEDVELLRA